MTDLKDRFGALFDGEPEPPNDLNRIVAGGRRALRRRNALTAVAGTAGTAAVTAAIVVPIAVNGTGGSRGAVTLLSSPTAVPSPPPCRRYLVPAPSNHDYSRALSRFLRAHPGMTALRPDGGRPRGFAVTLCPPGARGASAEDPTPTPGGPPYRYSADPRTIAEGFAAELHKRVTDVGLSIIYSRPFAQESSTLEKGHPSYYDGNVDVQLSDGPADIGVQVTHAVTTQVPFDGSCAAPQCTETTLPDGSVMRVSHVGPGGGDQISTVEIHHTDGLVVEAQEANYAFGPEATRARTKEQPLTIDQLTALAEDAAFSF